MRKMSVIVFGFLLGIALSAPVKVQEESETKFHGEDFHIQLPSLEAEITFLPSSRADVVLLRHGQVVGERAKVNQQMSHLVLANVNEQDEGVYIVKKPDTSEEFRRIRLIVRDCSNEESVMYGDTYNIHLLGVTAPITLEYRPEANATSKAAQILLTSTGLSRNGYQGRISVNDRHVSLSATTGADEGSYTVRDADGTIKRKVCLNVQEHYDFQELPYDGVLKINLRLDSSQVRLYYRPNNDTKQVLLMDKGQLSTSLKELGMEGRLHIEGSMVVLKNLRGSDVGQFKVVDALEFPVAVLHLTLQPYRLPMVFVAVIALCGLLAFLLLVCLLSCLWKVKKRARRAAELEKIAENAGKEDEGEAFRQVVKNMKQLNDDSKHSQADNTEKSQSTEVDIKGLEVSSKEVGVDNMETSDSGVGFNTTALPLDTDTDVGEQIPESEAGSISVAAATKASPAAAAAAAVTKPSAPPAVEIQPPAPDTIKSTPEPRLDIPTFAEVKLSPAQSPEPRAGLSPGSKLGERAKTPELKPIPSPGPALKASSPMAPSARTAPPTPESKPALTPTPEPSAAPESIPTFNGTPEPAPGSKASPEPALKAAPPKTPEVELKAEAGETTT